MNYRLSAIRAVTSNRSLAALACAAFAIAMLVVGGCSDGTGAEGTTGADVNALGDVGNLDITVSDTTLDVGPSDADTLSDVAPSDGLSGCPGAAGCPCSSNAECDIALCIDTPDGKACAAACVDTCKEGFSCSAIPTGSDTLTVCVPTYGRLCDPCVASSSCAALGQTAPACVVHGDGGSFCGADCKADTDCPGGYACKELPTVEGAKAQQCVPVGSGDLAVGACECSKAAIAAKLSTTCLAATKDDKGNAGAGCPGERTCGEAGLTACTSPEVKPEVCDGMDNDCNGKIDDVTCDDANACTVDACIAGDDGKVACTHTSSEVPCDADGSVCTEGDSCSDGACKAGPLKNCADSNPCTLEVCDPKQGCTKSNDNGAPCDDDNPCTIGEQCQDGGCLPGLPKACTSTDACQAPSCDQNTGKCKFAAKQDGLPCNDGTVCSASDVCKGGACQGDVIDCNDGNPCTDDACDDKGGCKSSDNSSPCNDNDACTTGDLCKDGSCMAGKATICDDKESCTLDSCNSAVGTCTFAAVAGCGGNCKLAADCNDGNPCTDDLCDEGKCGIVGNTKACDDGDVCTDKDACQGGLCSGVALSCDDGKPCTTDSCLPGKGCDYAANSVVCDDGDACTIGDGCAGGDCQGGAPKVCDDSNPCTDNGCDTKSGACTKVENSASCNDNDACTNGDVCKGGGCVAGTAKACDDNQVCTDDKCDPVSGACVVTNNAATCSDNNACTSGDACKSGVCKSGSAKSCDDKNACTTDSCNKTSGACVNTPIVGCGGQLRQSGRLRRQERVHQRRMHRRQVRKYGQLGVLRRWRRLHGGRCVQGWRLRRRRQEGVRRQQPLH